MPTHCRASTVVDRIARNPPCEYPASRDASRSQDFSRLRLLEQCRRRIVHVTLVAAARAATTREQDRVVLVESVCLVRRIHPGEENEYAEAANGLDR